MALIPCPECRRKVSSAAPHCPNCGIPIAAVPINNETKIVTIQSTSKSLKAQLYLSYFLFCSGILGWCLVVGEGGENSNASILMGWTILAGALLYFITKIRIWWNHG